MKRLLRLFILGALIVTVSCKNDGKEDTQIILDNTEGETKTKSREVPKTVDTDKRLVIELSSESDSNVGGKVIFNQKDGIVSMLASIKGLSEGKYTIDIDTKGSIVNFTVGEGGRGTANANSNEWCLGCDDKTKDITGKAIVVHPEGDDSKVSCSGTIE